MATETTNCPRCSGPLKTKLFLYISGATSPTNAGLQRNINQLHTVRTDTPYGEELNLCRRIKNSFPNIPANDQYRLEVSAEQDSGTLEYFWQLTIVLQENGETIVFRTPSQADKIDPDLMYQTWTRKMTEPSSLLDFSSAQIILNYVGPSLSVPYIDQFDPAQNERVQTQNVVLSWSGSYQGYDVEFGQPGDVQLVSQNQPGTTWDAGTLSVGEPYWYRISGVDDQGERTHYPWIQFTVEVTRWADNFQPVELWDTTTATLEWDGNHATWDVYFGPAGAPVLIAQDTASRSHQVAVELCGAYEWYVCGKDFATPIVYQLNYFEVNTDRGVDIGFDSGFGTTVCEGRGAYDESYDDSFDIAGH